MKNLIIMFVAAVVFASCKKQTSESDQKYPGDVELFSPEKDATARRPPKPPKGHGNPNNPPDTITPPPTTSGMTCIYLDFDGEQVNNIWGNFYAQPSGMTYEQQKQVLAIVRLRYAQFSIKVTDSLSVFLSYSIYKRMQVILTANSNLYPGSGGVAYVGSYLWGDGTQSLVFPDRYGNNVNWVGFAAAHEAGHMIGCWHQNVFDESCNYLSEYRPGWNMGTYNGQTFIWGVGCTQDDLLIINSNL